MINILSIIGYLLVVMYSGFMYWFLHSHFFYMALIMLAFAPIVSVAGVLLLRHFLDVEVKCVSDLHGRQDEETFFRINIKNPLPFPALDIRLHISICNDFFESYGEQIIAVPLHARKGYSFQLPINAHYPGIVRVSVKRIDIKDILGFYYVKQKTNAAAETTVLPLRLNDITYDSVNLKQGMLESEESKKRGNDFSDVQEIREYIPGDKLMSIHWKLSAKRDILMVKDRVSMSDKQLVVLPELCNSDSEGLSRVLSVVYSMICQMIEDKTTVRLMYFSVASYDYEDIRIDYPAELDEAFTRMFYEKTYKGPDEGAAHMAEVHPEIKAYIHVFSDNNEAVVCVRENE